MGKVEKYKKKHIGSLEALESLQDSWEKCKKKHNRYEDIFWQGMGPRRPRKGLNNPSQVNLVNQHMRLVTWSTKPWKMVDLGKSWELELQQPVRLVNHLRQGQPMKVPYQVQKAWSTNHIGWSTTT